MLQFKSANGSQGESAVGEVRKGQKHFQKGRSLKVYRASRWSAIGLIGDPGPKTVLNEGRLSHGSVYQFLTTAGATCAVLPLCERRHISPSSLREPRLSSFGVENVPHLCQ